MISNVVSSVMDDHDIGEQITELDPHANMLAVGKHANILADTGNKVDVIPLTQDYQALEKVSVVHAEVKYTCR